MYTKVSFVLVVAASIATPALAQIPSPQTATNVKQGAYTIEPHHTQVMFGVDHMGFTTYYGRFSDVSGTLVLSPRAPSTSKFEIHVPVSTISTTSETLDDELRGEQWFNSKKFPEIVFSSMNVTVTGQDTAKVAGNLTMHGLTKPVTLNVTFHGAGVNALDNKYMVGFEASGHLKRSDFGINPNLPLVGDGVDLIISAAFEKQNEGDTSDH
jgi:polyisoprenoid-binding protein YceI